MTRKSFAILLKTGSVAFLLFTLLFAGGSWEPSAGFIGSTYREMFAVLRDSETQWMVFLCLGIYFTAFIFLRSRVESGLAQRRNGTESGAHGMLRPTFWLVMALLFAAFQYAADYSPSLPALILLFGATIGQGMALLNKGKRKPESENAFGLLVVSLLVILLGVASLWNDEVGHSYAYRSQTRWAGPWDNPNIFGLLMGAGVALAAGMGLRGWRKEDGRSKVRSGVWRLASGKLVIVGLCLLAVVLMGRGLLNSYSRGAWVATAVGLAYLLGSRLWVLGSREAHTKLEIENWKPKILCDSGISWLKRNWVALTLIWVAVGIIGFWQFRQTDWHPARRALSAINPIDFSWRNRVAAWVGDLQMMAERPWFGVGWNKAEPLYEHYYLPAKLTESAAIQMNDYLILGATLGTPALFCFVMYLWLTLTGKAESRAHLIRPAATFSPSDAEKGSLDWLQTTCRAGAIVLLVGFWFDGGLFKLPTAATFWILLELGSQGNREIRKPRENKTGKPMIPPQKSTEGA